MIKLEYIEFRCLLYLTKCILMGQTFGKMFYFDIKTGRVDLLTYFTVLNIIKRLIFIFFETKKKNQHKSLPLFLSDIKFNFTHSACIFE